MARDNKRSTKKRVKSKFAKVDQAEINIANEIADIFWNSLKIVKPSPWTALASLELVSERVCAQFKIKRLTKNQMTFQKGEKSCELNTK